MTPANPQWHGLDRLRKWLEDQGFRIAKDDPDLENDCNWYAYRRSELSARVCAGNPEKPGQQIVVHPFLLPLRPVDETWGSVEVSVRGACQDGVWFYLKAYAITPDELIANLQSIEGRLIAAWNALEG